MGVRANEAGVVAVSSGPRGSPHGPTALTHDATERWASEPPGNLTRPTVVGGEAYVGTAGGFVVALG